MKKILLGLSLLIALNGATAQSAAGCRWVLGYYDEVVPNNGVLVINFCDNNGLEYEHISSASMSFIATNACISDDNGQLLFYTNGISVQNSSHQTMTNGSDIGRNDDPVINIVGLPMLQGALILPFPEHPDQYVLFHEEMFVEGDWLGARPLYYSVVDMSSENGAGALVQNSVVLSNDTLEYGKIAATRHANGRDWWVAVPRLSDGSLFMYLLGPDGVTNTGVTEPGVIRYREFGNAIFSPDGRYYVNASSSSSFSLWGFDRCSGTFSLIEHYFDPESPEDPGIVCFSPNSRYLYFTKLENVCQFDVEAASVSESRVVVAEHDGFTAPWGNSGFDMPTDFYHVQLAPDGKIYISSLVALPFLHIIEQPNEPGAVCNVRQHALELPISVSSLPNMPNYRLGALPGSPCDTLIMNSVHQAEVKELAPMRIFPNPAQSYFTIATDAPATLLRLYDGMGRQVFAQALASGQPEHRIALPAGLPAGVYVAVAVGSEGVLGRARVVVR